MTVHLGKRLRPTNRSPKYRIAGDLDRGASTQPRRTLALPEGCWRRFGLVHAFRQILRQRDPRWASRQPDDTHSAHLARPDSSVDNFVLRDGMQLSLAMNINEQVTTLVVPNEAKLRDGLHAFVFVQKAAGTVERRRVTTGRTDGQSTEVREGLVPGDEVIVAGARDLQTAYASLR